MSAPLTHGGLTGTAEPEGYSKLMSPNEAPRAGKDTGATNEGDTKIVDVIRSLYQSAKRARRRDGREERWQECTDFYNGKQWPVKPPAPRAAPVINITRPTVQTIVPIMTDTSPSFGLIAKDPQDFTFAEIFTEAMKKWWDTRAMNHVLVESIMDASVGDVGILKVVWNPDLDDGLGDVEVTVCDPKNIYVPRNAVDFNRNCPWVIHEFFKSRGWLSLKFPKFTDQIKRANAYKAPIDAPGVDTRVRVVSPTDQDRDAPDNKQAVGTTIAGNEDLRVWEAWLEDDTVIEEEQIDEGKDGEMAIKTIVKKKYPHGRLVTMLPDDKVVLQDVDNPHRDGEHPFVRIVNTLVPRSFYGQGDVEPLIEPQKMLNKTFAVILDWANMMVNCNWVLDDDSGVDPDMLTNLMGQIIIKKPNSTVTRDSPPPLPAQVFELYQTIMQFVDQASGVHDITQGRKPTGITAAEAIETLQEAGQTRIRLKERNLLVSLQRLGRLVVSRMLQYYTEPRVIRLTGRDDLKGAWPRYVKFFVEMTDDELYQLNHQTIEYNEDTGEYVEGNAAQAAPTIGDFDIQVTSGTSLPYMKEKRAQQAFEFFQAKAIDQKALLDVTDFPEADTIISRMTQEQAAAAQGQPAQ